MRPRTARATAIAGAAAVAVAIALVVPTQAKAQSGAFFGVSVLDTPSAVEFETMKRGGVDVVRLPVFWQIIEPTPGQRVWSRYDAIFAATAAAGIDVLPHLHLSPTWMNSNPQRPPLRTPDQLASWTRFVTDFAARYGRGGAFWASNPAIPARAPGHYQVWNEPNLRFFWGGKPNPKQYLRLLRAASAGLRAADPAARTVTGGLFREPRRGSGVSAVKYLDRLYRQRGARKTIDVVGLHPYAPRPASVVNAIRDARRVMRKRKDGAGRIWVTEFGWSVSGLGWKFSPVKAKPKQQAKRLKRTFRLIRKRRGLKVDRVLWFSWRDYDSDPNAKEFWIYRMGLFDLGGNPRPAWAAFATAAGGSP